MDESLERLRLRFWRRVILENSLTAGKFRAAPELFTLLGSMHPKFYDHGISTPGAVGDKFLHVAGPLPCRQLEGVFDPGAVRAVPGQGHPLAQALLVRVQRAVPQYLLTAVHDHEIKSTFVSGVELATLVIPIFACH